MALIHNIKEIVKDFIIEKYFEYLDTKNIILIKSNDLKQIIGDLYINNTKSVKAEVRCRLKAEMGQEYPSGSVENILLDIFQDSELNINRLVGEISKFQDSNYIERDYYLSNDSNNSKSLGLNIQIVKGYYEIVSVKPEFPNMEGVDKYKYLYSINGDELKGMKEEIISTIKNHINSCKENSKEGCNDIKLGLYYLRE